MKKLLTLTLAIVVLGWISFAIASKNLNSSRSNIYRVVHPAGVNVGPILPKFDAAGSKITEATVRKILDDARFNGIKKIVIVPPNTIILLTNPADEREARQMAGEPAPSAGRPPKASR